MGVVILLGAIVAQCLHAALMLAAAPMLVGAMNRLKARLLGRAGPPVPQPFADLVRLSRKRRVVAEGASPLFRAAPVIVFAATYAAALLVPSFTLGMASAKLSDLLVIAGLLALARCTMALAAMDAGTASGAIGASREMSFAAFAEPAFLLVILTLALPAGTTNLVEIAGLSRDGSQASGAAWGLALCAAVIVALCGGGRAPADILGGHQERATADEAMALEYSGRDLALIDYASALRLLLWCGLVFAVFVPFGAAGQGEGPLAWAVGVVAWAGKLAVGAVALAVWEMTTARWRVFRVPGLLGFAMLLGLLAAVFLFASQGFA